MSCSNDKYLIVKVYVEGVLRSLALGITYFLFTNLCYQYHKTVILNKIFLVMKLLHSYFDI